LHRFQDNTIRLAYDVDDLDQSFKWVARVKIIANVLILTVCMHTLANIVIFFDVGFSKISVTSEDTARSKIAKKPCAFGSHIGDNPIKISRKSGVRKKRVRRLLDRVLIDAW